MRTYGQILDGEILTYENFSKEVAARLKRYIMSDYKLSEKLCKKLYNKGYSIEDTCSFLILNSK
jgi:SOS response regulatory protein OraA/RecX